jgi:hypothetical protein
MTYRILLDFGAYEGMKFADESEYETVDDAVKAALADNHCVRFLVVQVVDWKAEQNQRVLA